VSITRARLACVVSYANSRFINGQTARHSPSRFTAALGKAFSARTGGVPEDLAQRLVDAAANL
jgi:superfamily I DNA/RNA helicase